MKNRSEYFFDDSTKQIELDIRHLFYGYEIGLKSQFLISAVNDYTQEKIR